MNFSHMVNYITGQAWATLHIGNARLTTEYTLAEMTAKQAELLCIGMIADNYLYILENQ